MTCATHDKTFAPFVVDGGMPKRGLLATIGNGLRWIGRAIVDARRRQAERDMGRFIAGSGGRLTDSIERQMLQHLCGPNSNLKG
ncbi:unnamed protein product [Phaeothamnion confervicola]